MSVKPCTTEIHLALIEASCAHSHLVSAAGEGVDHLQQRVAAGPDVGGRSERHGQDHEELADGDEPVLSERDRDVIADAVGEEEVARHPDKEVQQEGLRTMHD